MDDIKTKAKEFNVGEKFEKASKALGNLSVTVGRAAHKAMAAVGKAEVTRDIPYDQAKYLCQQNGKKLKQISVHVEKISELMHTILVVQDEIYNEFEHLYKLDAEGGQALTVYKEAITEVGAARETMHQSYTSEVSTPIKDYLLQYDIMSKRMDELEDRHTDMDRHYDKLIKLTEKTNGTKDNLPKVDAAYKQAKAMHDALHGEVMADFPKLQDDLVPFLTPIIAEFAKATATFWTATSHAYNGLGSTVQHISTGTQHGYPPVITPPDRSMMNFKGGPAPITVQPGAECAIEGDMGGSTVTVTVTHSTSPNHYGGASTPGGPSNSLVVSQPPQKRLSGSMYSTPGTGTGRAAPVQNTPTATTTQSGPPGRRLPPAPGGCQPPVAPPRGVQARALYTFNAQDPTELSFKKGDVIKIHTKEGDWWEGELNGARGILPANYVALI
ncbi:amphiphysin [Pelomyxa schiedti]|nr:amphiphysin [Pelomyxa schiedti]